MNDDKTSPAVPEPASKGMNYILSLKWTQHDEDCLTWWMPNNNGYTTRLERAGRYSDDDVRSAPGYYDNRTTTLAIPCDLVDRLSSRVVLSAASRPLLTEAMGEPADLAGTTVDDKDHDGRDHCPDCQRPYGRPGPSVIRFDGPDQPGGRRDSRAAMNDDKTSPADAGDRIGVARPG